MSRATTQLLQRTLVQRTLLQRTITTALSASLLLVLSACGVTIDNGTFACAERGECPSGYFCHSDGLCWSDPEDVLDTGPAPVDATPDTVMPDTAMPDTAMPDTTPPDTSAPDTTPPEPVCRSRPIDVVVVVDNTGSMTEEQLALKESFPGLVRGLLTGTREVGGEVLFDPTSVHIGVLTTDLGAEVDLPTCEEPGDNGVFVNSYRDRFPPPECEPSYPRFLSFDPSDGVFGVAQDFTCVASVGTGGCGVEQPLESALKALTPRGSDVDGHGDTIHAGFLRDDALLLVIVVTDGDDCSLANTALFAENDSLGNLSTRCERHPEYLHPIRRFSDGFQELVGARKDDLIFAPLVGIPETLIDLPPNELLVRDELRNVFLSDGSVRSSCTSPSGNAAPPRRILELEQALSFSESTVVHGSICTGFEPFFSRVLDTVSERITVCE